MQGVIPAKSGKAVLTDNGAEVASRGNAAGIRWSGC